MKSNSGLGKRKLTGSTLAKIIAYFLLAVSCMVGSVTAVITAVMVTEEVYSYGDTQLGLENWAKKGMNAAALSDLGDFYRTKWPKDSQKLKAALDEFCEGKNIRIEVWKQYVDEDKDAECILSNYNGFDTVYSYKKDFTEFEQKSKRTTFSSKTDPVMTEVRYELRGYVNPQFPIQDKYQVLYQYAEQLWKLRYDLPITLLVCICMCIGIFVFLMCGAGHRNDREGIAPGVLNCFHFDVLTIFFGVVALMGLKMLLGINYSDKLIALVIFSVLMTAEGVWCTLFCAEAALRFKMGQWWKHTLIYQLLRVLKKWMLYLGGGLSAIIKGLPLVVNTMIALAGITLAEFMGLCIFRDRSELVFVWSFEKLILIPVVLLIALMCKRLQEGSEALAEGNMSYQIDTSRMLLDFKAHGENLNRIGQGISKAVQERMKSEHMKTELITNVSHDIKTPLTSIINYADLLGHVAAEENHLNQEKVAEYSEVLLRQSKRLKKLLEDLVEASKATTGNLEVKMERCDVGVLLSQAVGEYEPRFWEKQLELIIKQPEETVWIMADGRRLWRVFDNLLNNVCKYAQENTRVYLTVEPEESQVEIIFRNMSKYALDMSGEELEERFVRGDKSRHMEGNGLGLSIAKSLVELQNGTLEIITDGDLFKVVLKFTMI